MAVRPESSSLMHYPALVYRGKHLVRVPEARLGCSTMLGKTSVNKPVILLSLIIYLIYCVPGKYCMKKPICWLL